MRGARCRKRVHACGWTDLCNPDVTIRKVIEKGLDALAGYVSRPYHLGVVNVGAIVDPFLRTPSARILDNHKVITRCIFERPFDFGARPGDIAQFRKMKAVQKAQRGSLQGQKSELKDQQRPSNSNTYRSTFGVPTAQIPEAANDEYVDA